MKRQNILLILIGTVTFGSSASATVIVPTAVALSGATSPAGTIYKSFTGAVLNSAGQVALSADLNSGSAPAGIFAGNAGSLQTVALQGSVAPGGGTYTGLGAPFAFNSAGQVAFYATANQVNSIFAGGSGSVQLALRQGTAAPGGGTYSSLLGINRNPVLNDAGQIAFHADLSSSSSTEGVFAGLPGAIQTVARIGTPSSIGGTFGDFLSPVLNGQGQVAVTAGVNTGGSGVQGIFLGTPGALQAVAVDGMVAPAGGNYHSFASFPGINSSGQVVFLSFLTGGSPFEGIFAGGLGSIQTVALEGTPAPSGGNYDALNTPLINSSGLVMFRSPLQGGSSSVGLFEGMPGAIETVALAGDPAPGGDSFSDFDVHGAINGLGQIAVAANLSGPSVNTSNDLGLYAGVRGNLVKIVREGDIIDIDPGVGVDNRTIKSFGFLGGSGGQDGHAISLNDWGLLIYQLTFTDGSSGVFTSSIAGVPEPSAVALFAIVAAMLYMPRKRCLDKQE